MCCHFVFDHFQNMCESRLLHKRSIFRIIVFISKNDLINTTSNLIEWSVFFYYQLLLLLLKYYNYSLLR